MFVALKPIFPVLNTPEAGGGAASAPPTPAAEPNPASGAQPAAEPEPSPEGAPDPGFDKILEAFEREEPDEVDEAPSAPAVEPTPAPPPPNPAVTPPVPAPLAAPVAPAGAPTAVAPPAPAPTPAVQPAAAPPAAPAVASAPSAEAPGQSPAPVAPTLPTQGFSEIAEGLKKSKAELVKAVAEQNYVLSDQDLEEFASDPRKVIGRVAAAAQIETTASVMKVLAEQIPVVVHNLLEANKRNQEAEDAFWNANRHLDRTKHRAETLQTYQQLRALQPNMAQDEAIRQVGQWMALKHGIPYQPNGFQAPQAQVAPQQVVHTPGPVVRVAVPGGFIPAGPQAAPASSHPQPQKSPFDRFFETMVLDESGAFEE